MQIKKNNSTKTSKYTLFNIPILKVKSKDNGFYSKKRYYFLGIPFGAKTTLYNIQEIKLFLSKIIDDNMNNFKYELLNQDTKQPKIIDKNKTIDILKNSNKSIARFGDGEFNLIFGNSINFQERNPTLQKRLIEILKSDTDNCCIAIMNVFSQLNDFKKESRCFWRNYLIENRKKIYNLLDFSKIYYDSLISRPYIDLENNKNTEKYFSEIKELWENKNVIFVEGKGSRLGYGNDLFSNTHSIKRIICPNINAFSHYREILSECSKQPKNTLFILALGPTATVLAYDLSQQGFKALDLGHIDIEYEWFKQKSIKKTIVENKNVNELGLEKNNQLDDLEYKSQIIFSCI